LVCTTRSMAQLQWIIILFWNMLQLWNCFNVGTTSYAHQSAKNMKKSNACSIVNFFNIKGPYKKTNHVQKQFLKDLLFYIAKGYYPLSSIENIWLKKVCPSFHFLVNKNLPTKLCRTWLIRPWNYMCFTPLLKQSQLLPLLICACVSKRFWYFCIGCKLHQQKMGSVPYHCWNF
jgi:hypothetical protein